MTRIQRQPTDTLMLGSIELFCLAAEEGNFTAAAVRAGLTPAAISRSVARLEARLGVKLFVRSTRRIALTDAGRQYHAQCRQALTQLVEAERELGGRQTEASGTVRISVPTPLGHARILPALPAFRARHPGVQLEVDVSNRTADFADGHDLAVRGRTPPDSGLVVRPLLDAELVVVASPDYIARAGVPQTPDDLARHDCLQFRRPRSGQHVPWLFRRDGRDLEMMTAGGFSCSDDLLGCITLARHGAGLMQMMRLSVEADLARGTLVEVLQPFGGRSRPFSLVYPANRHMPLRVRLLIDFLLARFEAPRSLPITS